MISRPSKKHKTSFALIGETSLLIQCAEYVLSQNNRCEIALVCTNTPEVLAWCKDRNLAVISDLVQFEQQVIKQQPDYLFSIVNYYKLSKGLLDSVGRHAINYHDALLPHYAGVNATSWAILNGEKQHGITWHLMTSEFDMGDILEQASVSINDEETALSLNLKCYEVALFSFKTLLHKLLENKITRLRQDSDQRTYHSYSDQLPSFGIINLADPAETINRMVRSSVYGDYPNRFGTIKCLIGKQFYYVVQADLFLSLGSDTKRAPGEVIAVDPGQWALATGTVPILPTLLDAHGNTVQLEAILTAEDILPPLSEGQCKTYEMQAAKLAVHEKYWVKEFSGKEPLFSQAILLTEEAIDSEYLALLCIYLYRTGRFEGNEFFIELQLSGECPEPNIMADSVPLSIRLTGQEAFAEVKAAVADKIAENKKHIGYLSDLFVRYPPLRPYRSVSTEKFKVPKEIQARLVSMAKQIETVQTIADFDLLTQEEYKNIIYGWNDNAEAYPQEKTISQVFEEKAKERPEDIALVYGAKKLTYAGLNEQANQLAHYLGSIYKIQPGDFVALSLGRNEQMIIATLAALKAGGAYVPIDPVYPRARIQFILEDTNAKVLLTEDFFELHFSQIQEQSKLNPSSITKSTDLACIVYTSGTTGKPKGVMIEHGNIVSLAINAGYMVVTKEDSIMQLADLAFDAAIFEIWAALLNGAKLFLPIDVLELLSNTDEFEKQLTKNKISILWLTKTLFDQLYLERKSLFRSLKYLLVGGEALNYPLVSVLLGSADRPAHFINGYGPTENTTFSCVFEANISNIKNLQTIPIGRAINNRKAYVLDANLRPLPMDSIGELYVGGAGVARGYLNQPDLTQKSFIANPFHDGHLYKTGDLVRWLPEGNLEYIGRRDLQIKIRGYRVELGEIENTLLNYPGIKQTVVIPEKESGQYLIGYYVSDGVLEEASLFECLKAKLPNHMIPATLVHLEYLPTTNNGKLNLAALPKPDFSEGRPLCSSPHNELEAQLCALYATILHLGSHEISIDDDFFALGGNSISAIQLVSKINRQIQSNIQVRDLFHERTPRKLAQRILSTRRQFLYKDYVVVEKDSKNLYQPFELSNVQQAYYFGRLGGFALGKVGTHIYQEYAFDFLDVAKLERALNILIKRHPMLRTVFINGEQACLKQYPHYEVKFYTMDSEETFAELRSQYSDKKYDPHTLWLFDLFVSQTKEQKMILHCSIDALIMDARSMEIFFDELSLLYQNPSCSLPQINIEYRDYIKAYYKTRSSNLLKDHQKYWEAKADKYCFDLNLPLVQKENEITEQQFVRISTEIDASIWKKVTLKAKQYGITPTIVILSVYGHVLSHWSNQEKVCVNLTLFNRLPLHEQINEVLGDFTVLELFNYKRPDSDKDRLFAIFKANHDMLWADIEHNLFDGIDFQRLLRERLSISAGKTIAPVVLTSLLGMEFGTKAILNESFQGMQYSITQTSQVWLDNKAYEREGKFVAEWDYVEAIFQKEIIEAMHADYCQLITSLAELDWDSVGFPKINVPGLDQKLIEAANSAMQAISEESLVSCYKNAINSIAFSDQVAIIDGGNENREYSHQALWDDSSILAHALLEKGLKKEELVAILSEKGYSQVLGTFAIMKAGGAYLPLHVDWPIARIHEILEKGGVKKVLLSRVQYFLKSKELESASFQYEFICIEDIFENEVAATQRLALLEAALPTILPDDLAYVIFTSGSTGTPKGVSITHRGALNTILAVNHKFDIGRGDSVFALSELSFDLSVYDIFGLLIAGGRIVFPDQKQTKEPWAWIALIEKYKITIWDTVPQLAQLLIDEAEKEKALLSSLRLFLLSGDWIPRQLPDRIRQYCAEARVMSLGGATEGSIWSIWYETNKIDEKWPSIPYGIAMPNQKMYVLSREGDHCPIGVIGEIHIGGLGVAIDYYQDHERTRASFIDHPILGRLYKTGDLGKWSQYGFIEFMGRKDHQVKINGYRVELEEISSKISKIKGVDEAITVLAKTEQHNRVIAYYTGKPLNQEKAILFLRSTLPAYMIPEQLIHLKKFPLTINGKLDRRALPIPEIRATMCWIAPGNAEEKLICNAFEEILDLKFVGIDDDFFALGGDSITAISLTSNLQKHCKLKIEDVFTLRTPKRIATVVALDQNSLKERFEQVKEHCTKSYRVALSPELEIQHTKYLESIQKLHFDDKKKKSIKTILLTGATGYLGCNLLNQLLRLTSYTIIVFVRATSQDAGFKRLNKKYQFYFDESLDHQRNKRLLVVTGDLSKEHLGLSQAEYRALIDKTDSVIHSAALTKHYGEYQKFYSENVQTTINLLEFSKQTRLRDFHYISTYAVLNQGFVPGRSAYLFTEDDNGEALAGHENLYVKTKYEGEQAVIRYRDQGVSGSIYRVGNLAFISKNGRTQENGEDSAFLNVLNGFLKLKMIAFELGDTNISPVDLTAEAITKLFDKEQLSNQTFHVFNRRPFNIADFFASHPKFGVQILPFNDFLDKIVEKLSNSPAREAVERFLLHQGWLGECKSFTKIHILEDKTNFILRQLGFSWQEVEASLFDGFLKRVYPDASQNKEA